jgi:LysR family transcriptional regulator, glycine cleavage system transcriptional activator
MAPLPPLSAVRAFEAAARHQSFTRAAEELGMTQAAISYQIKLLEERVGGPLFLRGPRGVALTDLGRRAAPAVSQAFAQLRAAFAELSETAEGILTITALGTFATNWLVPRLGAFQLAHPKLAVKLDASNELVDFSRVEVDVGIRSGHGKWPGLVAHALFPAAFTPMLSPRLLERWGPLQSPADLLKLPLIDPTDAWWLEWFAEAGVPSPDLSNRVEMRVENQQLAGRAALTGQGVAILMPAFFADELGSGLLVQPFPLVRTSPVSYWLVYLESRRRSLKIRAFRDWLLGAIGEGTDREGATP